jgi:hypothetical protein
MAINDTHPEYDKNLKRWHKMRVTVGGEDCIKEKRPEDYIPEFDEDDKEKTRYKKYLVRALYINYVGWTHQGLLGSVFRKAPDIQDLPTELDYLLTNADGAGQGLEQLSKEICSDPISMGRVGLLVDYPRSEGDRTLEDDKNQELQATISQYKAEDIFNWRTTTRNGNLIFTQIRLNEIEERIINEFSSEFEKRIRVLSLDPETGFYQQQLYDEAGAPIGELIEPKKKDGSRFDVIPFVIVGSEDNRPKVDKPPLLDIANVNLAHLRNSADQEENLFIHGQGTMFLSSDMSISQWNEANGKGGVRVGSRDGHFLGPNGKAILLQIQENTAIAAAMTDKVKQMIAIGARYIQDSGSAQETAEAARINSAQQTSGLNTLVGNVENGIITCLGWIADFMGGDITNIKFKLNRDFYDRTLTPQEATMLMLFADSGTLAQTDVRSRLRQTGVIQADRTDKDIDDDVELEPGLAE